MPLKNFLSRFASRIILSAGLVGLLTVGVQAQGPGGQGGRGQGGPGGGRMMMGGGMMGGGASLTGLLMMKEVRDELKLDEDQVKELEEIGKSMFESMRNFRPQGGGGGGGQPQPPSAEDMQKMAEQMQKATAESEAKIGEVLDPKQTDRLIGLLIQRDNIRSIASKMVATKLGITDEQKAKYDQINKEQGEEMRKLFQGGFNQDMRDKMREMREAGDAKLKDLLTAKQKEQMESLKGAEFKFPEPNWGRGGAGGPGGFGGGRGGPGGGAPGAPGAGRRPGGDN